MVSSIRYYHVFLVLLANPAWCLVTWYASTTHGVLATIPPEDDSYNEVASRSVELDNGAVDLLALLNLTADTPGVAAVDGPFPGGPAFKFRPSFGRVQVPHAERVAAALTHPGGFTLLFVYRQHRKSLGTLVSVHSPGRVTPWFQLTSNLRTGQLVLHYRITSDAKLHQASWPLSPPQSGKGRGSGWTRLALSIDTAAPSLSVSLDCQPQKEQRPAGKAPVSLDVPEDALVYFRQEPGFKKKFLGSMQVATIIPKPTRELSRLTCDKPTKRRPGRQYITSP